MREAEPREPADADADSRPLRWLSDPEKIREKVQEKGEEGLAEFLANEAESVALDQIFSLWPATGEEGLAEDAQEVALLDDAIHIGFKQLTEHLYSDLDIPGAALAGSIFQQIPLDFIDRSLGDVELVIEIAGVALCVMSGGPILACACFKALAHDLAHRALADVIKQGIKNLLAGGHAETPDDPHSRMLASLMDHSTDQTVYSPAEASAGSQLADSANDALTFWLARRVVSPEAGPREDTSATPTTSRPQPTEIPGHIEKAKKDEAPRAHPRASRLGRIEIQGSMKKDEAPPAHPTTSRSQPSEIHSGTDKPDGHGSLGAIESQESSVPAARKPGNKIRGPSAATAESAKLIFVRLRLHYELTAPADAVTHHDQPDRLIRLVVIRESCLVPLPEPLRAALSSDDAARMIKYIAHQPDEATWHGFRQLWRATDKEGLTLDPRSAAALRDNLIRIFMGYQAQLESTGLIAQNISADTAERLIGSDSRYVELVGIMDEISGKLQCMASKAMAHDEFCKIVISANKH